MQMKRGNALGCVIALLALSSCAQMMTEPAAPLTTAQQATTTSTTEKPSTPTTASTSMEQSAEPETGAIEGLEVLYIGSTPAPLM
jgi:glucose/arabinose dehydrogenase